MSWKGFQKALSRLPQIVKQKTGFSEESVDEEFKELNLTYTRIRQDTVSLLEEHQWHLQELAEDGSLEKTLQSLQDLRSELSGELEESVDRLLIKPLTEYKLLLTKVESIIKKRNNKLLDYDRHRVSFQKMSENPNRRHEMSEEKKIIKQEQSLNEATMEYERYNSLLKIELPRLLELRSELLKPGVEILIAFKRDFYTKSAAIFSSSTLNSLASKSAKESTQMKFDRIIEPVLQEARTLGLFHGTSLSGQKYSPPPEYSSVSQDNPILRKEAAAANSTSSKAPPRKHVVKALYDFTSEDKDELSFKVNDLIEVLDSSDQYGWWTGKSMKTGKGGNFPSNYVSNCN